MKYHVFGAMAFGIGKLEVFMLVGVLSIGLFSPAVFGQSNIGKPMEQVKGSNTAYGAARKQFSKLIPAIRQQTDRLNKIYAKYSDIRPSNSGPFWQQAEIWDDLMRSRNILRQERAVNLTVRQRAQLDAAC